MSGICAVRARVGDHVRMADRVADCPRCGLWWPVIPLLVFLTFCVIAPKLALFDILQEPVCD